MGTQTATHDGINRRRHLFFGRREHPAGRYYYGSVMSGNGNKIGGGDGQQQPRWDLNNKAMVDVLFSPFSSCYSSVNAQLQSPEKRVDPNGPVHYQKEVGSKKMLLLLLLSPPFLVSR
jgi:hypothetical protein